MSEPSEDADAEAALNRAVTLLGEYFDTVQVFVTRHDGEKDVTGQWDSGSGNFYARQGQVLAWVTIQDENARVHARRGNEEDES